MGNLLHIEVDAKAVLARLARLTPDVQARLLPAAKETAERVATEARRRVAIATGKTHEGIAVEPLDKGSGYAVVARRNPMPNVPIWLESGTVNMAAQPFFDVSVDLEQGPHLRRVAEALDDALEGLG